MLINEIVKEKKNTAAFAFGRLNPATNGHDLLVNAIKSQPGDPFLFLSDRIPKMPTDPLTPEDKLNWAKLSFDDIEIHLAKTALVAADKLYKMGYKNIIYLEGEHKLGPVIKKYNGIENPTHNYNFDNIKLVQLDRDEEAEGPKGMSATKLRNAAIDNDFQAFRLGVTDKARPHAKKMFDKLRGIMA